MGWAARLNRRRKRERRVFDRAASSDIAKRLRAGLDAFGVTVSAGQPIGRMIVDLEWIAAYTADPFEPGGAREAAPERFDRAYSRSLQAHQIAEILERAQRVVNITSHIRQWIPKQIDRIERADEQAQDHLFELEVATRLALWHLNGEGIEVSLEEPDISIRLPSEPAGGSQVLACKRPRSLSAIRANLQKGVTQIRDSRRVDPRRTGIVMINLDAMRDWQTIVSTPDGAAAEREGLARVARIASAAARDVERERDPACLGVHFSACFLHSVPGERYGYFWVDHSAPDPSIGTASASLDTLHRLLFTMPVSDA
jgi:hypothetical protein